MAMALKPLKEATVVMSEDSTPTLSVIAPLHAQLLHDTETGFSGEMPIVREIKQTIHEDLSKRYCTVREKSMLHAASTLDPRFKALPFLSQDEQQDIYSKVIAEAAALKRHRRSMLRSQVPQMKDKMINTLLFPKEGTLH
ncbi:Zinc finger BED domain-containing protein 1 [Merluccius polli]|uniref:Zinc finger BED domain-containing protein 1 n=1 Tax=Merluccius polli TaxID=89951 RepID=A0AA47MAV5_MERPO|nr:Zinc finger BED domain-containing protein 1 [Merluccius polli]